MAFPDDVLPIRSQILIDGTWTNIVDDTEGGPTITIRRGFSGEQANLGAAQCTFTLIDPDGRYSNRNPTSPYYRLIGRNTQYRNAVVEDVTSVRLDDYSSLTDGSYDGARVWTADKAVLDITGDIDVRIDCEPDQWYGGETFHLASKYDTEGGNHRSWTFVKHVTGRLLLLWSTDGTTSGWQYEYSSTFVPDVGRLALRATLDVNNGSGGRTVTFYTADTIAGPWTQLGSAQTTSGTTSIHSGAADLEVGTIGGGARYAIGSWVPFCGRIYAFELYNGIAGTRVANMDATGQARGTTTWSDGLTTPNTWTLAASAELTDYDYRFWGEIPKMPKQADMSGQYVTSAAAAADVVQRLSQGDKPLLSPIYLNLSQYELTGYWPMEDETGSSQSSAAVGKAGYINDATFGSDDELFGTSGVLTFNSDDGYASGVADPRFNTNTGTSYFLFYFKLPSIPGGTIGPIINMYTAGSSVHRIDIQVTATTYTLTFRDTGGGVLATSNTLFGGGGEPDQWIAMRLKMTQDGANIDWEWAWYAIGADTPLGISGTFAGTVGRPRSWISYEYTGKSGLKLAHVVTGQVDVDFTGAEFIDSTNGYAGEACDDRFARLCRTRGIPYWIVGKRTDAASESTAARMGPQRDIAFLQSLQECADVGAGLIYGPRNKFGLTLRLQTSLVNRTPVEVSCTDEHLSGELAGEEDDSLILNDVTVTKPTGEFARSVQNDGPLNILDPTADPDGVGVYDGTVSRSPYLPAKLQNYADYERMKGTVDELRYRKLQFNMEAGALVADPELTSRLRRLELGSALKLTDLPAWLPPDDVELLCRGYTETLANFTQQFVWNTAPYAPYRLNDLTGTDRSRQRVAASNTATANALDTDDTTIIIHTPLGAMWRRSAGAPSGTYPLDVTIGGEVISVPSCANVTLAFVAAGTVDHDNNASVTPGLPAGLLGGDLMLMLAAIRNTAAVVGADPAGWELLTSSENVSLFGKVAAGTFGAASSEAIPTVTFTGGAAGDDTSAQIAAWRPSSQLSAASEVASFMVDDTWLTNASAQDIIYPGAGVRWPDNGLVIYLGWKQDDWTSVASPGTEIGEPDTTTGNDQGMVWAYTIQTTKTRIAPGSFTVTGGVSAVSKGALVVVHPRHQLWSGVTRSVNGVVKEQTDEEVVQVVDYFRAAL